MNKGPAYRLFWVVMIFFSLAIATGCDTIRSFLPSKDDEVTKAYMAYRDAMLAGNIQGLKNHISKQKAHELDGPQAEQMLALARAMYPANAAVTGVNTQSDTSTLTASGTMEGGTVQGVIHMLKEDGAWKVYDEKWEMKMGLQQPVQPQTSAQVPDNSRPYDYAKAVGIWKGHEAGRSGDDWTFTIRSDYEITVEGPSGQHARGTAVADWSQGLEGGSMRVLRGGAVFDIRIADSSAPGHAGKLSLGSFKLVADTLQVCNSEPGLMKRMSEFASAGGIRCFELRKSQDLPQAPQPVQTQTQQPVQQPMPSSRPSSFSKQDPNVSGEAVVVKDGRTETYPLVTGFFSDTRFKQPDRATIQFQVSAPEHSNTRRIEITLDATKTGAHYADGKLLSDNFMGSDKIRIGEQGSHGYTASFRWVADGGQIFFPKPSCIVTITSPYTGTASGVFSGEVRDCPVHSAGIDYNISSVKFTMRGAPSR